MPRSVKTTTNTTEPGEAPKQRARALLLRVAGFRDCAPELLDRMLAIGVVRHYRRGEFVSRRGEPHTHVGMVIDGVLDSSVLQADGHRHLVGLLPAGGFYSLLGMVDGRGQTHDIVARGAACTLALPADALRLLRAGAPEIVQAFEYQMAQRMRLLYERLAADLAVPLGARAAAMVQTLADLYGRPEGNGIVLDVKLTQADLADWLGLSRQRVNFALKQLEAEGLLELRYSALTITNPAGLEARARG